MEALETLFGALRDAKQFEAEAKADRIAIEGKVLALIGEDAPENGSMTLKAGSTGRIAVKFGLSYKADVDAIRNLDLPGEVMPLKHNPASYELDKKAYEALRESHPTAFAQIAAHVATKPSKPTLTLKL